MGTFNGSFMNEIRIYDDPSNPESSGYKVFLPMTILEAVVDLTTGKTLVQLLAGLSGDLEGHAANTDIHTTAEWKNNVAQATGLITTHVSDENVHVTSEKQTAWDKAVEDSAAALQLANSNSGSISTMQGQIEQIMESLSGDITANPWAISFENLDGIEVTHGIYNAVKQRIEC